MHRKIIRLNSSDNNGIVIDVSNITKFYKIQNDSGFVVHVNNTPYIFHDISEFDYLLSFMCEHFMIYRNIDFCYINMNSVSSIEKPLVVLGIKNEVIYRVGFNNGGVYDIKVNVDSEYVDKRDELYDIIVNAWVSGYIGLVSDIFTFEI